MATLMCSLLIFLLVPHIRAEISVADYVYWTKSDIAAWHQYFPVRLLEQERLTNLKATDTASTVLDDMETSLAAIVRYQEQELETAQLIMEGTSAQGCVSGISGYMGKAIEEGLSSYQDCAADVVPQLQRLYASWGKTNDSYNSAYQKVLTGIDSCARTYPNRESWARLKTCVDSWTKNYFTIANATTTKLYWSPALSAFTQYVAGCTQDGVSRLVFKGWTFLNMLVQCSKLSENVDSEMYEKQLTSEYYKYVTSNNLVMQIWNAQWDNRDIVSRVEQEMLQYYDVQKKALEKYVIESRDQNYYYSQLSRYLRKYLNTISSTAADNPSEADCSSEANIALEKIINAGARRALDCDVDIVDNTKRLIARVNDNFLQINRILPYIGGVAIISCFSEGYIFAENTISNCFSLTLNEFNVNMTEFNATIVDDVAVLQGYEKSFFSNSSLPCGNSILSRATIEADRALYNLQRCLYINTGTKYRVTTSAPATTTSTTTTTTTTTSATEPTKTSLSTEATTVPFTTELYT